MIKRRLKIQYVFILVGALLVLPLLTIATMVRTNLEDTIIVEEEPDTITEEVIESPQPVMNVTTRIINPYIDSEVTIGKGYYDYQGEESAQINSILQHDNTYLQNTGIDFVSKNPFEIIAILDGTVTNVTEDESIGKTIEIKHENGCVALYQSLSEINVKKGDILTQGQVIGKSGTNELDKELGNHLHFEIYENGIAVNPENYLNKEVTLKKEN